MSDQVNKGGNPNWVKGGASPNPGGRPKKLVEIERMLDDEFRTVEQTRENYKKLRELALDGVTNDVYDVKGGGVVGTKTTYHPAYMQQLFDRLYGPVTSPPVDLSDVPEDELRVLREKLRQ